MEEAGSSCGEVTDWEFSAAAEELAIEDGALTYPRDGPLRKQVASVVFLT